MDQVENQVTEQAQQPVRVLHVQMTGAQTAETLNQVASVFRESLDSGKSDAVVTNGNVMTSVEYVLPGDSGIESVIVRPAMTPVEACAIAYQAQSHTVADEKPVHWNDLDLEVRQAHLNTGLTILNLGADADPDAGPVFVATLLALVPYLIAPSTALQVEVWTGETNLHAESAWAKIPFSGLHPQLIFRMPEQYPGQTFVSISGARIHYGAVDAQYVIDSSEAVVSGSKQIDDQDITKGFTLTWKIKEQEPTAPPPPAVPETEGLGSDEIVDEAEGLTPEQDPAVVTDVEASDVGTTDGKDQQ